MEEVEIWKDIEGYEGLYQVSNFGRVKSLPRNTTKGGVIKPIKNKDGYLYIVLCQNGKVKTFKTHRLVAITFLNNPNNLPCVNHKNEIKTDNRLENLEFCSYQYNNSYGTKPERISESLKGKHHTEEAKQKMSEAHKGKRRKPILQFTLDNVFIREWDSATTASKELKIHRGDITACCKEKRKSASGFIWKYKI